MSSATHRANRSTRLIVKRIIRQSTQSDEVKRKAIRHINKSRTYRLIGVGQIVLNVDSIDNRLVYCYGCLGLYNFVLGLLDHFSSNNELTGQAINSCQLGYHESFIPSTLCQCGRCCSC